MDRTGLADFLRRARERLAPADVGLPSGARRRTPGLRREEVAWLAGMSADYYRRLEQARGPRPSGRILSAIARGLRLTGEERDHLFRLAGEEPPRDRWLDAHVRPGLLLILDRLDDTPAQVIGYAGDVLAQNPMSAALFGDLTARPPEERNIAVRFFTDPAARALFPPEDLAGHARRHVGDLRAVLAARPGDAHVARIVRRLRGGSAEFERLWSGPGPGVCRQDTVRVRHPVVGPLELRREVLLSGEDEQRLVVLTARPGGESHERLRLLRVVGLQDFGGTG